MPASPGSSSSSGIEILAPPSPPRARSPSQPQPAQQQQSPPQINIASTSQSFQLPSTPPALRSYNNAQRTRSPAGSVLSSGGRVEKANRGDKLQVLQLGSSDDEMTQTQLDSDDEFTVLAFRPSASALPAPSSDDDLPLAADLLLDMGSLRAEARKLKKTQSAPPVVGQQLTARSSAFASAGTSGAIAVGRSASALEKGKGRALEVGSEGEGLPKVKKRKSAAGVDVGSGAGESGVGATTKKKSSSSTLTSLDAGSTSKQSKADERADKRAAKADEAARAKEYKSANLKQSDRKKTVSDLTCHLAGLGLFDPLTGEEMDADPDADSLFALPAKRGAKAKPKPSVWLEVAREFEERMKLFTLEIQREEKRGRDDLKSEGSVRWTRVCDRKWSEERKIFVPLGRGNEILVEEDSRLIFMTALELSWLIARGTLHAHINAIRSRLAPRINVFLMVHGLGSLFTKLRNAEGREYHARVLNKTVAPSSIGIGEGQPDKDTIELALVRLETISKLFIIQVQDAQEAAEWLEQLTFDVGFKPHQRKRFAHITQLGVGGDDKISSGRDTQDTFIKMLASIKGITEPLAKAILAEYPTVRDLYEAWGRCETEKQKKEMLIGIRKGNNLTGAATDRALGKAGSERIYKIFTDKDGDQFIAA